MTIREFWDRIRSSIFFVPGVLVLVGVVLAGLLVEADRQLSDKLLRSTPWLFRAGASGAREVLSTIASAMGQLAAITFSVTIVALALRSQQFGPRLLRNFTSDRLNQVILGTFIGTFAYCLLVLRAVRDLEDASLEHGTFVPLIAVTFAVVLALAALGLFIAFIQRVVDSIQATSIVAEAAEATHAAIEHLFPEQLGEDDEREDEEEPPPFVGAAEVRAPQTGYIVKMDKKKLLERTREAGVILRMEAPIGGFVVKGTALATVMPSSQMTAELHERLQEVYRIGRHRSVPDDPEFGIRQIVDVAVKALSPSMNDPTTAVTCVEFLGALLIDLATREIPSPLRRDEQGHLRVIALGSSFSGMVRLAFDQIQEHGREDVAVTVALLETLIRVARAVRAPARRQALEAQLWKVARGADDAIVDPADRERINELLRLAMEQVRGDEAGAVHYMLELRQAK
ncbi:MAG TPA: DUF2254 domain-containing protein [Longimicrobiaceae bacterium]|nr:DUF2254 domain-containing protein [Longimicrobiaceae bacterium]